MTTGSYKKTSPFMSPERRFAAFGGWLAVFWTLAGLLVIWHVTTVTGSGRGLRMMFETPDNAALMRVVLWLKVWLWAPFLILAPLGHRLMPGVAIVTVLIATVGESAVVWWLLDLDASKSRAIIGFNALVAVAWCGFLVRSKRVHAIRAAAWPVEDRVRQHFALLILVAGGVTLAVFVGPPETVADRVSMLTAWQFLLLLAVVLSIGPIRTLNSGRAVINIYLRRDVAIWLGIAGMLHLYAGTVQTMTPLYIGRFVELGTGGLADELRRQLFRWGIIGGLVILALLILLLSLSNDRSIVRLGKRWWKRLHRTSYVIFALTAAHALAFQYLEQRAGWIILFGLALTAAVVGLQAAGYVAVRRRRRRRRAARAAQR